MFHNKFLFICLVYVMSFWLFEEVSAHSYSAIASELQKVDVSTRMKFLEFHVMHGFALKHKNNTTNVEAIDNYDLDSFSGELYDYLKLKSKKNTVGPKNRLYFLDKYIDMFEVCQMFSPHCRKS